MLSVLTGQRLEGAVNFLRIVKEVAVGSFREFVSREMSKNTITATQDLVDTKQACQTFYRD